MKRILLIAAALCGAFTMNATAFAHDDGRYTVVGGAQGYARAPEPWRAQLAGQLDRFSDEALLTTRLAQSAGASPNIVREGYALAQAAGAMRSRLESGASLGVLMNELPQLRARQEHFTSALSAETHRLNLGTLRSRLQLMQVSFNETASALAIASQNHGREPAFRPAPPAPRPVIVANPRAPRGRVVVRNPRRSPPVYRPAPPARPGVVVSWQY